MYHPDYFSSLEAPEHSRRQGRIQLSGDEFDMLSPTEIARLLTIGHVVAHGLREIRAVDTPLESDPFVIYGVDAYHQDFRGDIRDPDGLKGMIEQSGNDDDV